MHFALIATVAFAVLSIVAYTAIDGMSGGYAIAFVAFFLAVGSIAIALLFVTRAREMDAILGSKNVLARWVYPDADAHMSAEREFCDFRQQNRAMFVVIGGMLAVVAFFFLVFVEEGGIETAAVLLCVLVLCYLVSRIAPVLERRRALAAPHEAYIAENGIIYEGALHPFRSFLLRMTGVSFRPAKKALPDAIVFSFVQIVGVTILKPYDVVIPVPEGEKENAAGIVRKLGGAVQGNDGD